MTYLIAGFNNLKINAKLSIGFALVLLVLMSPAWVSYRALEDVGGKLRTVAQRAHIIDAVQDVDRELLELRRLVREFASSGGDEDAKSVQLQSDKVANHVSESMGLIEDNEYLEAMKGIDAQIKGYSANIEKLVQIRLHQRQQNTNVLDVHGAKLRIDVKALQAEASKAGINTAIIHAGQAMHHLMVAQLNVNKMQSSRDVAFAKEADEAFNNFNSAMTALSADMKDGKFGESIRKIQALASEYIAAYKAVAMDAKGVDELLNGAMKREGAEIAELTAAMKERGVEGGRQIERTALSEIVASERLAAILSLLGLALGSAAAWLVGRSISVPITKITQLLLAQARGDKSHDVPYINRRDEIGDNARAASVFKSHLIGLEKLGAEKLAADKRAAAKRKQDFDKLAGSFELEVGGIIGSVTSASTDLEVSARKLTKTADTTQELSRAVAAASTEMSSNVTSVAAATEQLSSTVKEIGKQVRESSRVADHAVMQAEQVDTRMQELSTAASNIGNVVELIAGVASQTNLLALNATIEAARAGDVGRGFAVVAQEVKALAEQTAKATAEIASQITTMQQMTKDAVSYTKGIRDTIGNISHISTTIASAVEQQGATTNEIAGNIHQTAQGSNEVASNITNVSKGASETGSASNQVLSSAETLSTESKRLKAQVDTFLATLRAA